MSASEIAQKRHSRTAKIMKLGAANAADRKRLGKLARSADELAKAMAADIRKKKEAARVAEAQAESRGDKRPH
jgi:hypothetical protein